MKIVYVHQYFRKPTQSGGTRSYWIAKALVEKGHEVLIITSANNLDASKIYETDNGINILYLNVPYDNKLTVYKRLKAFIVFMLKSCYYVCKEKNVNLVYATSTPLTIGLPALVRKWLKRTKFVFEVRDLWPEVPIQMGALNNPIIIKIAKFFEKTIYKNASHIIALSPGMKQGVCAVVKDKTKVSMIPNMSKIDEFYVRPVSDAQKIQLGIDPTKFNMIHFGAMGKANGLEYVFDAAKLAQEKGLHNLNFVFLGEGLLLETYQAFVKEHQLNNIRFLGTKTLIEVSEIVNACQVSLVSFADLEILKTNSPNKLFDSLSAGKPVIVNSAGWTKTMVEENQCGFYVNINNPLELVDKLVELSKNKTLCDRLGQNARKLAETKYDKSILVPQIINIIEDTHTNNV